MAIGYKEQSAASVPTPAAGEQYTFIDSADNVLKRKDSTGAVTPVEVAAGNVSSVYGRTGAVVATSGDYTAAQVTNVPHGTITHVQVQAAINHLEDNKTPITHVGSKGVAQHAVADGTDAGFMSPSDKTKLDGIAAGATVNDTNANLRDRATHTGSQLASTISDFSTAADSRVTAGILTHVSQADPHPGYALDADVTAAQTFAINRANHTGTQPVSTVSGFNPAVDARVTLGVAAHEAAADPHPGYALETDALLKAGDTMTGQLVMEGDGAGTGNVNLKAQSVIPATPASGVSVFASPDEMFSVRGQSGFSFKLNDQNLTEHRQFDLPDADVGLMGNPMTTLGDSIYGGASGAPTRLGVGAEDDIYRVVGGVPTWQPENLGQDFSGGSLGDATISGAVTLTQETYYNQLTLAPGAAINCNGFNLYAKKLIANVAGIAGAIHGNGNNGVNGSGTTGGNGGAALLAAVLGASGAGGNGAAGSANAGIQGTAGTNLTTCNGGAGGASGNSGAGGTGAFASGVSGGTVTNYTKLDKFVYEAIRGILLINGGTGGRGGNSGGGDGAQISRGGGGGGGGARLVKCYFGEIVTSASTPAGVIQANGGTGGTNVAVPATGNVGGCGGAGGGGGGGIILMYGKRTGPSVANFVQANGGNGGNGGQGLGTGIAGNGGQGGNGGSINAFNVSTNMGTEVIGTVGSAGTAGSGAATPGVGGNGGLCQLTI